MHLRIDRVPVPPARRVAGGTTGGLPNVVSDEAKA
jgi:hypothetical protein